MVMTAVGTFVGDLALGVAKARVGKAIDKGLSGDAIKEAIQQAVSAADGEVPELFSPYERQGLKGIDGFLQGAFREVAIAELQKPLQDEGKPNDALLTQVFLREAKSHSKLKDAEESCVADWMRAFTDAYFETTNSFLRFQVVQAQYYRQLRSKTGKVVFSGMAVDGTVVDEPGELAKIFVMPDVQRQTAKDFERAERPLPEIAEDSQKLVLWEQQQQFRLRKDYTVGQTPVSAVGLLKAKGEQRIVILGAPGAGKTTLMNYWVVKATSPQAQANSLEGAASGSVPLSDALFGTGHCLPVLIRVRDLVRKPNLSVLDFLIKFAKADLEVEDIPAGFFQHWLSRGDALILVDGLDEVADDGQRRKVVEKIETFLGAYEQCPAIITSRPAGYRDDYFSRKQYPHYELLPFDDEKIETFITHWYDSRVDVPTERERNKESLRDALAKKPRIKQLARNPLLLTMIALIHRYKTLPRQRHELYNSAVETLISTWDEDKALTTKTELKYLNLPDIRRLMERLAYWVHVQGSVSDAENGTQIERGAMVRQLAKSIKEVKASEKLQLYQAEAEAETLLDKIVKDRAGLLSKQGENRYAFVHKTFQEYLCSQEILYLQKDQDSDEEGYVRYVKQHIKKYLHDPHWREVLLLLVAQQTPSPAKASLKTILKAGSEYEQWLHRDVLFAGSCLAENAEVSDQGIIDEILTELVSLETSSQLNLSSKLRGEVFRVITDLQDTSFAPVAMKHLASYQPHIKQQRLIDYQCKLAPDKATLQLLRLLKDDDSAVRYRAIESLGQLGQPSEAVVAALVSLVKDNNSDVRYLTAASLGQLGQSSEVVVTALMSLVRDDDLDVRYLVAMSLGQLGQSSEAVVAALVSLLKDNSPVVCYRAAESLGQLGQLSEAVVAALVSLLKNGNSDVRSLVAMSLGQLGQSSEAVVAVLVSLLKDDNSDVRYRAAESLGQLGQSSEAVIASLVSRLKDNNPAVRYRAAESLGQLGQLSEAAVAVLVSLLKDDNSDVRYRAAESLGRLGQLSEEVIVALVSLLKDDDSGARCRAAASLGRLRQSSQAVVAALLALLKDNNPAVRCHAAASLGQLGQSSQAVVAALLALLKDDDSDVRYYAAASLGQLEQSSQAVVAALLELLEDDKDDIGSDFERDCDRAAQHLITLAQKSDTVKPALIQWIEQNQHEAYVGNGIDVLWEIAN